MSALKSRQTCPFASWTLLSLFSNQKYKFKIDKNQALAILDLIVLCIHCTQLIYCSLIGVASGDFPAIQITSKRLGLTKTTFIEECRHWLGGRSAWNYQVEFNPHTFATPVVALFSHKDECGPSNLPNTTAPLT